jgi:hypothetical protein
MRYYIDPFVFEQPQSKRKASEQYPRRNGFYHPEPMVMEAIARNQKNQQQRRRQKHVDQASWKPIQGDGLEFLLLSPKALQRVQDSRNPRQGRTDGRKQCQVPSPSPFRMMPHSSASNKNNNIRNPAADPFLETLFGVAPSSRCQRHDVGAKEPKLVDDELLQILFPGTTRAQAQPAEIKNIATTPRRQQQDREQALKEVILKSLFGEQPSKMKEASKPTGQPTGERKKSDRNVAFADPNPIGSVYQLPQQWHTETTTEALILSIDVTGFGMDDLNLQVDPIRRGSAQLTLKAKRTNALGEVWELNRSKVLNSEEYRINAVEATCEDDKILRITIPKKIEPSFSHATIPIRPTARNEKQEKNQGADDSVKPFTMENLLEAMVTDFAHANEANKRETKAESREEQKEERRDEANEGVTLSLEDLLVAMADQFEQSFRESNNSASGVKTSSECEVSKEEVDKKGKESKPSTGVESKQEQPEESKPSTGIDIEKEKPEEKHSVTGTALKASLVVDAEEKVKEEPKPESLVDAPSPHESPLAANVPIVETAEEESSTTETEVVWERTKSSGDDTAPTESLPEEGAEDEDSKSDENQPKSENVFKPEESFGIIFESKDAEDNQSWEEVDEFGSEQAQAHPSDQN